MAEHIGYRLERHNAHMAAVRACQRRGQLERVSIAIARHKARDRAGVLADRERKTLGLLVELHEEIQAEIWAVGQEPRPQSFHCRQEDTAILSHSRLWGAATKFA